jgi:hypothetical protein
LVEKQRFAMAKIDVHKIKRNDMALMTGVEPSLTCK